MSGATGTPESVLSHGLKGGGYPLLDPADVRFGVDRGDGVLGTFTGTGAVNVRLEDAGVALR